MNQTQYDHRSIVPRRAGIHTQLNNLTACIEFHLGQAKVPWILHLNISPSLDHRDSLFLRSFGVSLHHQVV